MSPYNSESKYDANYKWRVYLAKEWDAFQAPYIFSGAHTGYGCSDHFEQYHMSSLSLNQ